MLFMIVLANGEFVCQCPSFGTILVTTNPRNRLSPRFINKATTAEPIQGGEENLLKADKDNKRKHGKPKLATENMNTIPSGIGAP